MEESKISQIKNVYAIRNTTAGVRAINELLERGFDLYWSSEGYSVRTNRFEAGTFLASVKHKTVVKQLVKRYPIVVHKLPVGLAICCRPLRLVRIALYYGQGIDGLNARFKAYTQNTLEFLGFKYVLLDQDDVKANALENFDCFIVPAGDASEIFGGWNLKFSWNQEPWQLPGSAKGLGETGISRINEFIRRGGGYVGIGSGGGALACQEFGGLAKVKILKFELRPNKFAYVVGHARVYLKVSEKMSPVVYGFSGYVDEKRQEHSGIFPAYYFSDPRTLSCGGPVFEVGKGVEVIATYHDVDNESWTGLFPNPEPFKREYPAIVEQRLESGHLILFGIDPTYGSSWISTFRLLSNSIYYLTSKALLNVAVID